MITRTAAAAIPLTRGLSPLPPNAVVTFTNDTPKTHSTKELVVMRKGLQRHRPLSRRPILESLESRTLLSSDMLFVGHGYQFETILNTVDPLTSINTHFAFDVSGETTTDASGNSAATFFCAIVITISDAKGQTLASFLQTSYTTSTPPYSIAVSPTGNTAQFDGTFQMTNDLTAATDTLAIHLAWKLDAARLRSTDETLALIPDASQYSSVIDYESNAASTGTLNWTALEPALADYLPSAMSVTPGNSSGGYSNSYRQTTALSPKSNLSAILSLVTPPNRVPKNAGIQSSGVRNAFANSEDGNSFIDAGDVFQWVSASDVPMPITPSASIISFTPDHYVVVGLDSGISISPDLHSAAISTVTSASLNCFDGTWLPVSLNVDLHWQWTGQKPTITLNKFTAYESDYTRIFYQQIVNYPAVVSGTISSDNPLVSFPIFSSASIQSESSVEITTPASAAQSYQITSVSQQTWQQTILQPWRDTTPLINILRPCIKRAEHPAFHLFPFGKPIRFTHTNAPAKILSLTTSQP